MRSNYLWPVKCAYPLSPGCPSQFWDIYRDDSQSSDEKLPLIAIPKSPPLANTCRANGRIIFPRVLAFALPLDFELKWAEDNQIGLGKRPLIRRSLTRPTILSRLTPDCRRTAVVKLSNGSVCQSIVVATNKTVEDLERAKDDTVRPASHGYNGAPSVVSPPTNLVSCTSLPRYYSHPAPILPDSQIIVVVYFVAYCPVY